MGSALTLPRGNMFNVDPHDHLCIVTPTKRDDAGPMDKVDPKHPCCEKAERPITHEEIADVNARGVLQAIRIVRDGTELGIVAIGRRRTRMARAVNDLRHEWNKGGTNWLFPEKRADGEQEKPFLAVPSMLIQGDALSLRGAMIAENVQRAGYSPLQLAAQLKEYMDMGATPEATASVCGQKLWFVKAHMSLLDCSENVQKAVESGSMKVTAAQKIAELPRDQQDAALAKVQAEGKTMTAVEAKRAVKGAKSGKGEEADNTPSKGEVARMLILIQNEGGELTPTQRATAIAMLEWVRSGKRPKEFKLPRLNAALPKAEKADK